MRIEVEVLLKLLRTIDHREHVFADLAYGAQIEYGQVSEDFLGQFRDDEGLACGYCGVQVVGVVEELTPRHSTQGVVLSRDPCVQVPDRLKCDGASIGGARL